VRSGAFRNSKANTVDESRADLRKSHITFDDDDTCMQSTSRETYINHGRYESAGLSDDVKADLSSSHFSIGTCHNRERWLTSYNSAFIDFPTVVNTNERFRGACPATACIFPFEDNCDYLTESKRRYIPHQVGEVNRADILRNDLRSSHFMLSNDPEEIPISQTQDDFKKRVGLGGSSLLATHSDTATRDLKHELSKSHFTLAM
jgi:hypothetical protein